MSRAEAMAAASVTRTNSIARFRFMIDSLRSLIQE
jgi:hypothetical protein